MKLLFLCNRKEDESIMKRLRNLYQNMYKFENIKSAFDEVCSNTRNKKKANKFKELECINIFKVYSVLKNRIYKPGPYYRFEIYEPKKRKVVSQTMFDKLINHLVARQVLMPSILPCLISANVASRPRTWNKSRIGPVL
mgnify:CR=1 FL=1